MGKAIRDEDLRLNIIVNGDESQKRIGDLSRQTRDLANANFELRQEQRRLKAEGKENTELYRQNAAEIKKNAAIIKSNKEQMQQLRSEMKLDTLTISDLTQEQRRLRAVFNNAIPGTTEQHATRGTSCNGWPAGSASSSARSRPDSPQCRLQSWAPRKPVPPFWSMTKL